MNISQPSPLSSQLVTQARPTLDRSNRSETEPESAKVPAKGQRSLWEILTPEERDFFAQTPALTYRPGTQNRESKPTPLGRQLDVRG